jgi:hypothetical protein
VRIDEGEGEENAQNINTPSFLNSLLSNWARMAHSPFSMVVVQTLLQRNNSSLDMPLALMAFPTSASLP